MLSRASKRTRLTVSRYEGKTEEEGLKTVV